MIGKRKYLLLVFMLLSTFVMVFMNSGLAKADPFARGRWVGYFNNRTETSGDDLIPGGINVYDIDSFVNFYRNALNSGNIQLQVSASFTILTMLGYPAGTWWGEGWTQFGEWERTVRWYAANGRIQWATNYSYGFNTYYQRASTDVAWYYNNGTLPSIIFINLDLSTYAIKRDCANPVGNMTPLVIPPPPPPPTVVLCGSMNSSTSNPEVGQLMNVVVRPSFSGGPPVPNVTGGYIRVTGPGLNTTWPLSPSPAPPAGPTGGSMTFRTPDFLVPATGVYTVTWDLRVNGVAPTPTSPCGGTYNLTFDSFEAVALPFFASRGSDVAAGSRFVTSPGGSCGSSNTNAGITSWNKGTAPYLGAGSQYGASAWSFIQGFSTNQNSTWSPTSLSLSNIDAPTQNSVDVANGRYGGYFGQGPCVEYWKDKPATGPAVPNSALTAMDGVYVHPTGTNLTINAATIPNDRSITIYVEGNVNIRGDIRYGGAPDPSWTSTSQIPVFKLIVKGVIHIESTVQRLDGIYVAVPADVPANTYHTQATSYATPRAGTISTCSTGFAVRSPAAIPVAPTVDICDNFRLTVNGSLIANQVFFLRSIGTMSAGVSAEQFDFSPEVWLAPNDQGGIDPAYQSIIGLPPVL